METCGTKLGLPPFDPCPGSGGKLEDPSAGSVQHEGVSSLAGLCAMVLTYNRKDLLRDCINSLRQQTASCDLILIVDNASTDGTFQMVRSEFPDVELVRLRKNLGAAGGFAVGMRLAAATGAERMWIMDDDMICEPEALAELVSALDLVEADGLDPPFVISTAHAPDGSLTDVPEICFDTQENGFKSWATYLDRGVVAVTRATMGAILLPRRTIERYGYPLSSMFIWGEDAEYTCRITRESPGYLCGRSRVLHRRAQIGVLDIRTETNPTRISWHRYLTRNQIYTARRHRGFLRTGWRVWLEVRSCLQLLATGRIGHALLIGRGIAEGLFFRPDPSDFDRRFDRAGIEYASPAMRSRFGLFEPGTGPVPAQADAQCLQGHRLS